MTPCQHHRHREMIERNIGLLRNCIVYPKTDKYELDIGRFTRMVSCGEELVD